MKLQNTNKNISVEKRVYTTADQMLEAFQEMGVSYIFANLGSDHPALIESFARFQQEGREMPEVLICQHEMVALSAAHGYAQLTGEPQVVLIHVDCGTQNLGGAVHNAARGRIPVLIFAGTSPATQEGELMGSRNEYIHWIQDVSDQRGIVREYTKYTNEIRTGKNVKQLLQRSMQLATSDPKGPVYLMAAREVLEEKVEEVTLDLSKWGALSPSAIPPNRIAEIGSELLQAENPLIVTTYLGRNHESVEELIKLAERLAIPVLESAPSYMNFPSEHPLHVGYVWNEPVQDEQLAKADLILVLDSDVPWIPLNNKPQENCKIYYVDVDPLKEKTPLWYIPSESYFKADTHIVLQQINEFLTHQTINEKLITSRFNKVADYHSKQRIDWAALEAPTAEGAITPEFLTTCIREVVDNDTIIMSETITNFSTVNKHLPREKPGTYFSMGASSLGWNGGASIGAKLASPDKLVVSLSGDGCYIFSNPTPVHWMSRKYNVPFLTIIYNNEQWNAPKFSALGVHPNGVANEIGEFWTKFGPSSDLAKVAEAAGGAYAVTITSPDILKQELKKAIEVVKGGRSAVVDVRVTGR
ncbi:thiamine pyrophosphate-requiring protein [Alkalihalophilus pseudofirmus]|uniref:Thiamine pyrophosphate-requiring protein n=1 Tax=Alkalihalophilus pseudofirmus TaxID=79885 RepID=A0AAJ2KVC4_ALKPS|nr:thiamine pyrophosphate-requiring protein [Alkalihalophilus pseudofirmus]MDV2883705.1 thiamine pyrophosphate-requiring protein [Alkalihalophilus pseudofirmus]